MKKPLILIWLDNSLPYLGALEQTNLKEKIELKILRQSEMPSDDMLSRVEGIIARSIPEPLIASMPSLRWIQTLSVAVDHWLGRKDLRSELMLTCARGVHKTQMPETIIGSLLYITRRFDVLAHQQAEHIWYRIPPDPIAGKTLSILGLGTLGSEVARKLEPFQMQIIGTQRNPRITPYVDEVFAPEMTDLVLKRSDFVLLLLPVTPDTEDIINRKSLKLMKPTAYLLNFGRGKLVVDEDLIEAVNRKVIRGAVLDVFRQEPLRSDHPFWNTEGIKVLPHIGGMHPSRDSIVAELFVRNLHAFVDDQPMLEIVDRSKGY